MAVACVMRRLHIPHASDGSIRKSGWVRAIIPKPQVDGILHVVLDIALFTLAFIHPLALLVLATVPQSSALNR